MNGDFSRVRIDPLQKASRRPSKITVPEKANPLARLVFAEMKRQGVTYAELEWKSGVLISTFKAWRTDNRPGLESIEAALGALGWALVPVPQRERLPEHLQETLLEVGQHFRSDEECFGAVLHAIATWPVYQEEKLGRPCKPAPGSLPAQRLAARDQERIAA